MLSTADVAAVVSTGTVWVAALLGFYFYTSYCLAILAENTQPEKTWWAWIPILNLLLMLKIAGKPWWWVFLLIIPLVNLVFLALTWGAIAEKVGKPAWWGWLLLIFPIGPFVPGYLVSISTKDGKKNLIPLVFCGLILVGWIWGTLWAGSYPLQTLLQGKDPFPDSGEQITH